MVESSCVACVQNQGQTQSEAMSEITFAHEVGHSFGSHHDDLEPEHPGAVCNEFKQHFGTRLLGCSAHLSPECALVRACALPLAS